MKRTLTTLILAILSTILATRARADADANTLVWCGLNYSKVKMIGTEDFRDPRNIFPGMLNAWNALFVAEMIPELERMAHSVETDLQSVETINGKASASQIERQNGTRKEMVDPTHITNDDIARIVRDYKLEHHQGTGLTFVMDRLVKAQNTGCLYVLFFDVASRKVLQSERVVAEAGGIGFRNFWFRPVKTAVKGLPKAYKNIQPKK